MKNIKSWSAAAICALAGAAVFQFFGNANHGYIDTNSLFWWWGYQWVDPRSETQHGWLVLAIAVGLVVRAVWRPETGDRKRDTGNRIPDSGDRSGDTGGGMPEIGDRKPDTGYRKADSGEWTSGDGAEGRADPRRKPELGPKSCGLRNEAPAAGRGPDFPVSGIRFPVSAGAAMSGGLALHAVAFSAQQARLSIVALLLFTWGVLRLGGGRRWGRAAAFPLAFMVFAIPLNALDSVGFWLRLAVTQASAHLAHAAHIDVGQNGTQLVAPDGRYNYDVAAACSGIRSLMALAALSLLIGYLEFRTWWRRALMLGLCFPLVYVGNVARITSIIFAAQAGGSKWGDIAHAVMGLGVFVIVLGGVWAAAGLLRRFAPEAANVGGVPSPRGLAGASPSRGEGTPPTPKGDESRGEGTPPTTKGDESRGEAVRPAQAFQGTPPTPRGDDLRGGSTPPTGRFIVALAVVALSGLAMGYLHHVATAPARGEVGVALAPDGRDPVALPMFVGHDWVGYPAEVSAAEREILPPDTGYSRMTYVATRDNRQVFLSIVLSGRDRTSIHRPELCLVGQGFTLAGQSSHVFSSSVPGRAAFNATVLHVRHEQRTPRGPVQVPYLVAYWFVTGDAVAATHWQRLALDTWNRVVHGRADRWAYVLLYTDATDGEAAAFGRMQAVLDGTMPIFERPPVP